MRRHCEAGVLQQFGHDGIDLRGRPHTSAEGFDLPAADGVRDGFGHHAARGVAL
jgi:hypothetical protein